MATTDSARPEATPERRIPERQAPSVVRTDDGRRIAYATYGPSTGDPVVFFHGAPGSRRLGALLEPTAQANDIRVVAPDRPGYGRSSPHPDRTAADVAAALDCATSTAGELLRKAEAAVVERAVESE